MTCDHCSSEAITFIRYNGSHLCDRHFMSYVERRVKKELRAQVDLSRGMRIGVAVSGGKDSMVTLDLVHRILGKIRDVEIHCISVDEGIEGYRGPSLKIVQRYCQEHSIPYHEVSMKENIGIDMDFIAPHCVEHSPCTYCGVFRRKCLNAKARELGCGHLATGLNLDDTAQSLLMNFVRGDIERMARMGPHTKIQPGLIPRIQPLRVIPEKESYLYAIVTGLDFHDDECPYADAALRNQYRWITDELESRSPGSKFSILSSYEKLAPLLRDNIPAAELHSCRCGEPTLGSKCRACALLDELMKKLKKSENE